jgi:nucleotide-binding universal stress UspA family protein
MGGVLLATDGSEYGKRAAERAVELADERGTDLYVLCVVDERKYVEPALSSEELANIMVEDHGYDCVTEVESMAADRGVDVEGEICHGVPHEVILDRAKTSGAALIVIGEHGEHDEHFGGVGNKVAEQADVEVLVVQAKPQ